MSDRLSSASSTIPPVTLGAGKTIPSRLPTRRRFAHSTEAMNRAVSPVRITRLTDSPTTATNCSMCGRATVRSAEVAECEWAASSNTGPAR